MIKAKAKKIRDAVLRSLRKQGYTVQKGLISLPPNADKDTFRALHQLSIKHKRENSKPALYRKQDDLIDYIANGVEVNPERITPRIHLVQPNTIEELLFRFATLHWSIPVSSGYGRRLRFLVFDDYNDKLVGLFGLGDPVYALHDRDSWIGWNSDVKREKLYHVMDAYVLGAVPPYSSLLGGKLIAMLVLSNEVRAAFRRKYSGTRTVIQRKSRPPYLALVTTTSALGRSSLYNRLRHDGVDFWNSIGFTKGYGEFHFSNGVYGRIRDLVEKKCEPTAKQEAWGSGFRNKREVVRKCLPLLGLSADLLHHGIEREVFAACLGTKSLEFLRGEVSRPHFYDRPARLLADFCMERWILPRAHRQAEYKAFDRECYQLWK
jgi:hypothetical protein